jgi:hypothetical protein
MKRDHPLSLYLFPPCPSSAYLKHSANVVDQAIELTKIVSRVLSGAIAAVEIL